MKHAIEVSNVPVESTDHNGFTPLHVAAFIGNFDAVQYLLEDFSAQVNPHSKQGFTPLHRAVMANQPNIISLLLKNGAKSTLADNRGVSPLSLAITLLNEPLVELLMLTLAGEADADIHNQVLLEFVQHNVDAILIVKLLGFGVAQVNTKGPSRMTPLHFAAWQGNDKAVEILIAAGAVVNSPNIEGNTPLMLACLTGNADAAQILLNNGASTELANFLGTTALHLAARSCSSALLQTILSHTEKQEQSDGNGLNALHHAAIACDDPSIIQHLASLIAVNSHPIHKHEQKALNLAISHNNWKSAFALACLGAKYGKSTRQILTQAARLPANRIAAQNIVYALEHKDSSLLLWFGSKNFDILAQALE